MLFLHVNTHTNILNIFQRGTFLADFFGGRSLTHDNHQTLAAMYWLPKNVTKLL